VQYSIRLLLPPGSPLLALPETQPHLREFDAEKFTFLWTHPDPGMDHLQKEIAARAEMAAQSQEDAVASFVAIHDLICRAAAPPSRKKFLPPLPALAPPRLTEHWFC